MTQPGPQGLPKLTQRNPTAAELALARKCAAKYWQTGDGFDEASARSILSGEWDDFAYTQAALAGIMEATDRAENLAGLVWIKTDDPVERATAFNIKEALRRGDHLKQEPRDDADS